MSFNSDPSNQGQEVILNRKLQKNCHLPIYFNNNPNEQVSSQKHLAMILDVKLNFQE